MTASLINRNGTGDVNGRKLKRRYRACLEPVEDLAAAVVERGNSQGGRHAGQARTRGGREAV
jgi:hypothetical protein